ncbi:MAG: 3-isopropylmalate dehydratase small subunit [SAR324 cluster bacterium]|nr:3-isopropylmalate dehydratase small subunit [SAR324 cluster bacterium]
MKQFTTIKSIAAPILLPNIDTDIIIPMNRYTAKQKYPICHYAFEPLRYLGDADQRNRNLDFVLNKQIFRKVKILLTGENFACGSSREAAVSALAGLGIRCLLGSSFGEIFYNNCLQQGLLPINLPSEQVSTFAEEAESGEFTIDLKTNKIITPSGNTVYFVINEFRKNCLLEGLDDLAMTLQYDHEISAYQANDQQVFPWIYQVNPSA